MLAAGLLLARRGNGSWADPEEYGFDDSNNLKRAYGGLGWGPSEFGYRADDDDLYDAYVWVDDDGADTND